MNAKIPKPAFKPTRFAAVLLSGLLMSAISHAEPVAINFSEALQGLNFDASSLDFNGEGREIGNGILDASEMALVAAVLADPTIDFSLNGGISHSKLYEGYLQTQQAAMTDLASLIGMWPTSVNVTIGYTLLGQASFDKFNAMTASFGAPLNGDYSVAIATGELLSMAGDADGDGLSNRDEFLGSSDLASFIAAALNPDIRPDPEHAVASTLPINITRTVGIVLYPDFEVLDVYGPLEMWSYVPGFNVVLIAEKEGPVKSAQGAETIANYSFETAPPIDILMVPGGNGTREQLNNFKLLDYLKTTNENTEFTTSVCTGSALLAKAGILNGHRATTNKRFFFLAEEQSQEVDWVVDARWVESGKMFSSSGVSAGTDMALGLIAKIHGIEAARGLASSVEYEWHEDANLDPFAQFASRLVTSEEGGTGTLVRSEPSANSSNTSAPQYLRLYFDKQPKIEGSVVSLYPANAPENPIPLRGMHNMGANDLMMEISRTLPPGQYVVDYQATFNASAVESTGSLQFTIE